VRVGNMFTAPLVARSKTDIYALNYDNTPPTLASDIFLIKELYSILEKNSDQVLIQYCCSISVAPGFLR
jgi:hypothetical protein